MTSGYHQQAKCISLVTPDKRGGTDFQMLYVNTAICSQAILVFTVCDWEEISLATCNDFALTLSVFFK